MYKYIGWKNNNNNNNNNTIVEQQKQQHEDQDNDDNNDNNADDDDNKIKIIKEKTEKLRNKKKLWTVSLLKLTCHLFGLPKNGDRENLIIKLINYLYQPTIIIKNNDNNNSGSNNNKRKIVQKNDKKNKKGKKNNKNEQKNPPNAYILFSSEYREEIHNENPHIKVTEIMGE